MENYKSISVTNTSIIKSRKPIEQITISSLEVNEFATEGEKLLLFLQQILEKMKMNTVLKYFLFVSLSTYKLKSSEMFIIF